MDIAVEQDASAAPSPAQPEPQQQQPEPAIPDSRKDPAAYQHWRQTGEIKQAKESKPTKDAEPAPAKQSPADAEQAEGKSAASEAEHKTQEKPKPQRSEAATRLEELLADIKRAGLTPAELKTFKREAAAQAKQSETTAQPPAQQPEPLKKPKLADFQSWEEFEAARDKYDEQRTTQAIQRAIQEDRAQQAQRAAAEQAAAKLAEAKQRYGAEAEPAILATNQRIFNDQSIHPAVKGLINDSPVIADLLYVMGSKPEDFDEFVKLAQTNPGQAIRKVVLLESLVTDELKKQQTATATNGNANGQARDESGQFVKAAPPAKPVKEAPPPATEVSGKSSPPKDALEAAFDRDDFRAFRNEANRQDRARKG